MIRTAGSRETLVPDRAQTKHERGQDPGEAAADRACLPRTPYPTEWRNLRGDSRCPGEGDRPFPDSSCAAYWHPSANSPKF